MQIYKISSPVDIFSEKYDHEEHGPICGIHNFKTLFRFSETTNCQSMFGSLTRNSQFVNYDGDMLITTSIRRVADSVSATELCSVSAWKRDSIDSSLQSDSISIFSIIDLLTENRFLIVHVTASHWCKQRHAHQPAVATRWIKSKSNVFWTWH